MGLIKKLSKKKLSEPEAPVKTVEVSKPASTLPADPAMDITEDTRLSRNSLVAEDALDDSMLSFYVVDEDSKVSGTVQKETKETKVGISLQKSPAAKSILIRAIKEGGLFAATDLKVGQKVLTINGTPCPSATVDAARLIAETEGTLTIEAADLKKDEGPEEQMDDFETGDEDDARILDQDEILEIAKSDGPPFDAQSASTVEMVTESEEKAEEGELPSEIAVNSRDIPEEPEKSNENETGYSTSKYVLGAAAATGTVLIGSFLARASISRR